MIINNELFSVIGSRREFRSNQYFRHGSSVRQMIPSMLALALALALTSVHVSAETAEEEHVITDYGVCGSKRFNSRWRSVCKGSGSVYCSIGDAIPADRNDTLTSVNHIAAKHTVEGALPIGRNDLTEM